MGMEALPRPSYPRMDTPLFHRLATTSVHPFSPTVFRLADHSVEKSMIPFFQSRSIVVRINV